MCVSFPMCVYTYICVHQNMDWRAAVVDFFEDLLSTNLGFVPCSCCSMCVQCTSYFVPVNIFFISFELLTWSVLPKEYITYINIKNCIVYVYFILNVSILA